MIPSPGIASGTVSLGIIEMNPTNQAFRNYEAANNKSRITVATPDWILKHDIQPWDGVPLAPEPKAPSKMSFSMSSDKTTSAAWCAPKNGDKATLNVFLTTKRREGD